MHDHKVGMKLQTFMEKNEDDFDPWSKGIKAALRGYDLINEMTNRLVEANTNQKTF